MVVVFLITSIPLVRTENRHLRLMSGRLQQGSVKFVQPEWRSLLQRFLLSGAPSAKLVSEEGFQPSNGFASQAGWQKVFL